MDDLMSIGEFSERSGLSPKRLRSYAADGILIPAAVDPATGYRYYSPAQLRDANLIDALREASMPLARIDAFLREPSDDQLDAWEQQLDSAATARRNALQRARTFGATHVRKEQGGTMRLQAAGRSETGHVRDNNEDAIVGTDRLAAVADGMGGAPGGEIAAHAATQLISAVFTGRSVDELSAAVRAANWAIWDRAAGQGELGGMGTTICAVGVLDDDRLAVAHVGDSRAYLWRDGELALLTRDHTVVADLIGRGELSEDEALRHPHFGVLTRAVGVAPDVTVDTSVHRIAAGDRLVVCSDGLVNEVSTVQIAGALNRDDDVATVAERLVEAALAQGGRDNVSVVVADVVSSSSHLG